MSPMKKPKFSVAASSTKKPKMTFSRFMPLPADPASRARAPAESLVVNFGTGHSEYAAHWPGVAALVSGWVRSNSLARASSWAWAASADSAWYAGRIRLVTVEAR